MFNCSRLVVLRQHLPQLLEADSIGLRFTVLAQIVLGVELLGEVTVASLGKDGTLGSQLHAPREGILWRAAQEGMVGARFLKYLKTTCNLLSDVFQGAEIYSCSTLLRFALQPPPGMQRDKILTTI